MKLMRILLVGFVLFTTQLAAQVKTVVFKEFESDEFLSSSKSLGKEGVALYGWDDKTTFVIRQLDTNLEQKNIWKITTEKSTRQTGMAWQEDKKRILVWFSVKGFFKYRLVVIDADKTKFKSLEVEFPSKTYPVSGMIPVNDEIWFNTRAKGGYFIYRLNITSGKFAVLDPAFGEAKPKAVISSLSVLSNNEVAIIHSYGPKKKRETDVKVVDAKGKAIVNSLLASVDAEKRNSILDATVTRLGEKDYALTGTYRKNSKKKVMGNGVYFARYSNQKVNYLSFFDYSDFEHFFDYRGEKASEKIEAKIEKKKSKGKDVTVNTLSISHAALPTADGLVFIAEYFYPTYRYEYTTQVVNGQTRQVRERVFDGFDYSHGMALGISSSGEKLWDQYIPLHNSYKPMVPVKFLKTFSDSSNTVTVLHTTGKYVFSSVLKNGTVNNNKWAVLHTIEEGQKEKWTNSASMWWYGKTFFVLEKQKTKEKGLLGKRTIKYYGAGVRVD